MKITLWTKLAVGAAIVSAAVATSLLKETKLGGPLERPAGIERISIFIFES